MARGSIFHGLAEGPIRFLPTYKFEKNRESSIMQPFYDQGEKMRVPAWTDRVFFRASAPQQAALQPNSAESPADVRVSVWAVCGVRRMHRGDWGGEWGGVRLHLPVCACSCLRQVERAQPT
jgi:hypothetical protein